MTVIEDSRGAVSASIFILKGVERLRYGMRREMRAF
jgi:hypothetical protein